MIDTALAARQRFQAIIGEALEYTDARATPTDILRDMSEMHEGELKDHLFEQAALFREAAEGCYPVSRAKPFIAFADHLEKDAKGNPKAAFWRPMTFIGRKTALEWCFTKLGFTAAQRKACLARGSIDPRRDSARRLAALKGEAA